MLHEGEHASERTVDVCEGNFRTSTVRREHLLGDCQAAANAFLLWNKATINGERHSIWNRPNESDPLILAACLILSAAPSVAAPCRETVGPIRAETYVHQCLEVSPATHPPCNAANSCGLIVSEIQRGCRLLMASERPAFCAPYMH